MLITRADIAALKELSSSTNLVPLGSIPSGFQEEFDKFFLGKTLIKKDNELFAHPHDIRRWVDSVFNTYSN